MTLVARLSSALKDHYRIERELGQGGMATVYLASALMMCAAALLSLVACNSPESRHPASPTYLYLWTGSADSTQPDFLAVLDVTEDSVRYARLVTTVREPRVLADGKTVLVSHL